MLTLEAQICAQINRDENCSQNSSRLMAMRSDMINLIRQRNGFGVETIPIVPVLRQTGGPNRSRPPANVGQQNLHEISRNEWLI